MDDFQTVITQFNVEHSDLNCDNLQLKSLNGYVYKNNKKISYLYFQKVFSKLDNTPDLNNTLVFPAGTTDRLINKIGSVKKRFTVENHLVVVFDKLTCKQATSTPSETKLSYQELLERYQSLVNSKEHIEQMLHTHVDTIELELIHDVDDNLLHSLKDYVPNYDSLNANERFLLVKKIVTLAYKSNSWVQNISNRNINTLIKLIRLVVSQD